MKRTLLLLLVAVVWGALGANPLDELLPVPKLVQARPGVVTDPSILDAPMVCTGSIAGAPPRVADESYRLEVGENGVRILAPHAKGVRYAKTTLRQLRLLSGGEVPCCLIEDWPSMPYRGLMQDCGRNYIDLGSIRKLLDLMADYKLNLFHWHITDYYGWRLESKKYPMLQAPWAFRRQLGKYYTQEEFKDIVAYARERGITVMPEMDVPGHSLAFRRGLGIEHMAEKRVKGIVGELIDELCSLVPAEDMPFVHLGTDEARTPWEMVPDSYCPFWAERVFANGRLPVGWMPGKSMLTREGRKAVGMVWHEGECVGDDQLCFDTVRCYFGSKDPFSFLNTAVFSKPLRVDAPERNKLGVVLCSWHDDSLGDDGSRVFGNNNIALAVTMLSDLQWSERPVDRPQYLFHLPKVGTPDFDEAVAFENRVVAHRDKVAVSHGLPFCYVRQTPMRWRFTTDDGRVLAKDHADAYAVICACAHNNLVTATNSLITVTKGCVYAETWIFSPTTQEVGALIGFTDFDRSGGRKLGIPELGEWGRSPGTRVHVNGRELAPPRWGNAGLKNLMTHPEEPSSNNVAETPFTNEEYFMREPTPLTLRQGWNHVRLTVTKTTDDWSYAWTSLFVPVLPTTPVREVPGLVFSSDPPPLSLSAIAGSIPESKKRAKIYDADHR